MSKKVLTKRDIDDFLAGAEILGTGGGGGIGWARGMLEYIDEYDKKISLIDPTDVPEEDLVVGAAGVGGGVTPEVREKIEKKFGARPSMKDFMKTGILAEKMLSGYLGENIYAYLAFELGCGNTILRACIAAMNDKPVVDGDCNGRAVPEIELCTLNVKGIPFTPISISLDSISSLVEDPNKMTDLTLYLLAHRMIISLSSSVIIPVTSFVCASSIFFEIEYFLQSRRQNLRSVGHWHSL